MMLRQGFVSLVLAAATVPSACTDRPENVPAGTPTFAVRDSAGIEIVEVSASALAALPRWSLLPDPVLVIGRNEDDPRTQFFRIQGVAVVGGSVLVADGGSQEIRRFDPAGVSIDVIGGRGEGPGEFQNLSLIRARGETGLIAWDHDLGRVSTFDVATSGMRFEAARLVMGPPMTAIGAFESGELLVSVLPEASPMQRGALNSGGEVPYALATLSDQPEFRSLGSVPGRPIFLSETGLPVPQPFTVLPSFAVGRDAFWVGNGSALEVRRVGRDGVVAKIFRLPSAGAVTSDHVGAFTQRYLRDSSGEARASLAAVLEVIPLPDVLPAFDQLLVDTDDRIWVRTFPAAAPPNPTHEWCVLDPERGGSGCVSLPPEDRLHSVAGDRVIAVARDESGVEYVRVHVIERGLP